MELCNGKIKSSNQLTISMSNNDCLLHIFSYLPIIDRIRIQRVNKQWNMISKLRWQDMNTLDLQMNSWSAKASIGQITITAHAVKQILRQCGNSLTNINFGQDTDYGDIRRELRIVADKHFFSSIAEYCTNLQSLDVSGLKVTSDGMRVLVKRCSNITKFSIGFCQNDVEEHIPEFLKNATKLQYLGLRGTNISSRCLTETFNTSIEILELHGFPNEISFSLINDFGKILQHLSNLHTLIIDSCISLEKHCPNLLKPISFYTRNLKSLILRSEYSKSSLYLKTKYMYGLKNLQEIELFETFQVHDMSLIFLASNCKELKRVTLCSLKITDCSVAQILQLPKLEHLQMQVLGNVSGRVLIHATNLKTLKLINCDLIENDYLDILLKLSLNLETLYIDCCEMVDTDVLVKFAISEIKSKRYSGKYLSIYINYDAAYDKGYNSKVKVEQLSSYLRVINMSL